MIYTVCVSAFSLHQHLAIGKSLAPGILHVSSIHRQRPNEAPACPAAPIPRSTSRKDFSFPIRHTISICVSEEAHFLLVRHLDRGRDRLATYSRVAKQAQRANLCKLLPTLRWPQETLYCTCALEASERSINRQRSNA